MKNNFFQKHLLSIDNLNKQDISFLFEKTAEMEKMVSQKGGNDLLKGKILAALFFEPSSRTFSSFVTAVQRLGGGFIPLNGMSNTSIAKGETLEDSVKAFCSYADVLVIRFPKAGSAQKAADNSTVPVINAGDGAGEHPSQALLDSYTILKHFSSYDSLTVGMIGDLLYGRTVHSLSKLLFKLGVKKFILVSPKMLKMPGDIFDALKQKGVEIIETDDLNKYIGDMDVIYDTRVQKERFTDLKVYEKLKHAYVIDKKLMEKAKKTAILMHPLPRVCEIATEVDKDKRALYFREEMRNGLFMRMALLDAILRK